MSVILTLLLLMVKAYFLLSIIYFVSTFPRESELCEISFKQIKSPYNAFCAF